MNNVMKKNKEIVKQEILSRLSLEDGHPQYQYFSLPSTPTSVFRRWSSPIPVRLSATNSLSTHAAFRTHLWRLRSTLLSVMKKPTLGLSL